ncbi:MAG: hypothetical protein FWC76_01025 [Defluviitaleaceae bacterium]|nr:hypothetical protein [Defluviitaleaceae bacterium]
MLFKLMKYDFVYSARLFFALGTIAIALAFILGGVDGLYQGYRIMFAGQEQSIIFTPNSTFMQMLSIVLIPVGVAAIIHIAQFYHKSMFGKAGHLAMTMPVSRGTVLLSKITVSFAWVLYVIAVAMAMVAVTHIISPYLSLTLFFTFIDIGTIAFIVHTAIVALAAIPLLFFCITLSNSVFIGVRLNGIIAGFIGFLYAGIYAYLADRLTMRFTPAIDAMIMNPGTIWEQHTIVRVPLMGLQYGRIVIGQRPWGGHDVYIDIFFIALTLAIAAIAAAATHSLLKKRVSLQ